ncbi:bifunctional glutamate--cysteine ligase GshA/glutathione synthetase GshB [Eubacterium barkeri]|uniref:Glutamate--cysteine ligase n=1 Tax=Eubacterium barkeri TaxID=1528 RepID=A0A1H3AIX1_EUBBA|nr:bifunctional glutamate--cysteine ligase GshA/glutathione synthetase GshB [Eubacterium barkeri]SDX29114.1 glutamate--cysteine ligase [Eubacterium barkeri]
MATESKTFGLPGYEDMELSTQIIMREAMEAGVAVTVLDRGENLIELRKDGRREFVQQATKTSRDNYITPLLMENKAVSKLLMAEAGIPVPAGIEIQKEESYTGILPLWVGRKLVVKPKSTNFGLGITVIDHPAELSELEAAVRLAFDFDRVILLEDFIPGKEYRFLVLEGETLAVLHRRAANVVGNGLSTIRELVNSKNKDPRRGDDHEKPLNKIILDDAALGFLKAQGLTPESIPAENQRITLRGNSNISTGGDSIDYTDVMPQVFKDLAVRAAGVFDAFICGVDLIIEDYLNPQSPHAIIEVNYNPHIAMQCYPYRGKERRLGKAVLDKLMDLD